MTVTYFSHSDVSGALCTFARGMLFFLGCTKVFFGYKRHKVIFFWDTKVFSWETKCFFSGYTKLLDIFEGQMGLIDCKIVLDILEGRRVSPIVQLLLTLWKGFFSSCVFRRRAMPRKGWSTVEVPMDGCKSFEGRGRSEVASRQGSDAHAAEAQCDCCASTACFDASAPRSEQLHNEDPTSPFPSSRQANRHVSFLHGRTNALQQSL